MLQGVGEMRQGESGGQNTRSLESPGSVLGAGKHITECGPILASKCSMNRVAASFGGLFGSPISRCSALRSAPILSAVINPHDFDTLLLYAIDGDVGQGREQKLPSSFLASGTTEMWPLCQRLDRGIHFAYRCQPVMRMVVSEMIADVLQVRGGSWGPADTHFYERNICSRRASISSCSMNSPRSACAMPSRTAARKRASS